VITGGIIALLFALLFLGAPVAFATGIAGMVGLFLLGGSQLVLGVLKTAPHSAIANYELITIPMFIMMAEFTVISGVADELFSTARVWLGRVRGGLAVATAVAGAAFGAISGSSTASAATLASTSIPAMVHHGYDGRLANGVVSISGTLAMLIPPSLAVILYGILTEESIGKLLIAGVVPGILVMLTIILTVYFLVWRDPSRAPVSRAFTMREKVTSLKVTGPFIVLFMAVTGVIYLGVATPTEASALGAGGALILACVRGRMTKRGLLLAIWGSASTTAMIVMIIVGALVFGYFLTLTRTTQDFVEWVSVLPVPTWTIMLVILSLYLVLGFVMDQVAILILTIPILYPLILNLGYDPIWFGIMVIVMAEVGMVTPPVGLNVYVVARYTGVPVQEVFAGVFPHVVAHLILIVFLMLFPGLILWLPSTMGP
jgi:tripartite ATP-independent transporter DctM subunit